MSLSQRLEDGRGEQWDPAVVNVFVIQFAGSAARREVAKGLWRFVGIGAGAGRGRDQRRTISRANSGK